MTARRAWLRALAIAPLIAVASARAQDPRTGEVMYVAREWLALVDRNDTQASHAKAGTRFRRALDVPTWGAALAKERVPRGEVTQRAAAGTRFDKSVSGFPDGEYAFVLFRTAFANKVDSRETVTLEREADGAWRVIGYAIQ